MNKPLLQAAAIALLLLLAGCSPSVMSITLKTYTPRPVETVQILNASQGQEAPQPSDTIGEVLVMRTAIKAKDEYDRLSDLAAEVTAKKGGDILLVTQYKRPNFWSSRHVLRGIMLLHAPTAGALPTTEATESRPPRHIFKMDGGYGWTAGDFFQPLNNIYQNRYSPSWRASYSYMLLPTVGLKLAYDGTHYDFPTNDLTQHYVGLGLTSRYYLPRNWVVDEAFTLGCAFANDEIKKQHSFGATCDLGVEYMLTRHVGIGAEFNLIYSRYLSPYANSSLIKPGTWDLDENLLRLSLTGGLRFYI